MQVVKSRRKMGYVDLSLMSGDERFRDFDLLQPLASELDMFVDVTPYMASSSVEPTHTVRPRVSQSYTCIELTNDACICELFSPQDTGVYVIREDAPTPRVFRLFRHVGLRHLCVVDDRNVVRGIITRKDITG